METPCSATSLATDLEIELRNLRSDEHERNVTQVFDISETADDLQRIDQDSVKVARRGLVEHPCLFEGVHDENLETELFDRLDNTRIVMQGVDEEDASTGVRNERLLTDLFEVPLADLATDGEGDEV